MPGDPIAEPTGLGATIGKPGESVVNTASRAVSSSYGQAHAAGDQIATFIRDQPIAAAVIALGIGYILGRLRI